jgi:DNA-binding response OmpR family regulator
MMDAGRILLADDDETFRRSTADLLRRAGFACETAADGGDAAARLRDGDPEVLVADIHMRGNVNLELVQALADAEGHPPVILVTGYPSLDSAVRSVGLPVEAYLVKPFEFDDLLAAVRRAIERFRLRRAVRETNARLAGVAADLDALRRATDVSRDGVSSIATGTYLLLSLRVILASLTDIHHLVSSVVGAPEKVDACGLFDCPRVERLSESVRKAIDVLEETKGAFKSKALGDLRRNLTDLLAEVSGAAAATDVRADADPREDADTR